MMMGILEWIAAYLSAPLVTLSLGAFLSHYFMTKSKRDEYKFRNRSQQYINLLTKLQSFVEEETCPELRREFFNEYYQGWLYCSDDVILKINELIALVRDGDTDLQRRKQVIGEVVVAMRKDKMQDSELNWDVFEYNDV